MFIGCIWVTKERKRSGVCAVSLEATAEETRSFHVTQGVDAPDAFPGLCSTLFSAPSSPSTTMSAPHTPARAIPSSLLSRTAPTIPPASQAYEPLVKRVLRHRQYKIFLHSALLSWLLVTAWRTWSGGDGDFWLLPIRPSTVAYTLATFATGALPIVILRKSHVAGESSSVSIAKRYSYVSSVQRLLLPRRPHLSL